LLQHTQVVRQQIRRHGQQCHQLGRGGVSGQQRIGDAQPGRDQQAAGRVRVTSAGSQPASELNPAVVAAMAEIGLDISHEFPRPLTAGKVQAADIVITMGCGDACPVYPGKRYLDWDLPDPAGLAVEQVRPIRDEISARVRALVSELGS
jgi:arsenate reductase (thioredoxin)